MKKSEGDAMTRWRRCYDALCTTFRYASDAFPTSMWLFRKLQGS